MEVRSIYRAKDTIDGKVKSLSNDQLEKELLLVNAFANIPMITNATEWRTALQTEREDRIRKGLIR